MSRHGYAGQGVAGVVRQVKVRRGDAWLGEAGMAGCGKFW